jgi:hypothetical protein
MKKHWYLWALLSVGILIIAGGVYWLLPKQDHPQYQQAEITALVKTKLVELGIEGHKIDSVDSVASVKYLDDGRWTGSAEVSYSYLTSSPDFHSILPSTATIITKPSKLEPWDSRQTTTPEVKIILPPQEDTYSTVTRTKTVIIGWVYYEKLNVVEIVK